jgi:hypothetical protein
MLLQMKDYCEFKVSEMVVVAYFILLSNVKLQGTQVLFGFNFQRILK